MLRNESQRRFRRGYGIRCMLGANGSGKTAIAVHDLLPTLDAGFPLLSTCRILDWRNPRECDDSACTWPGHPQHGAAHPGWIAFTDWRQLLEFTDGAVFMDEVGGIASSRESSSLPFQVARELQKLRKRNVTLTWTAPAWARADKIMRECTQLAVFCRGLASKAQTSDDMTAAWRVNRATYAKSYDARALDSDSAHKRSVTKAKGHDLLWLPGLDALKAYDTYDVVSSLGWANDSGICMGCGGRRAAPRCDCPSVAGDVIALVSPARPPGRGRHRATT